jgi:hypothetical protein
LIEKQHFSVPQGALAFRRQIQSEVLQLGNGELGDFEVSIIVKAESDEFRERDVTGNSA